MMKKLGLVALIGAMSNKALARDTAGGDFETADEQTEATQNPFDGADTPPAPEVNTVTVTEEVTYDCGEGDEFKKFLGQFYGAQNLPKNTRTALLNVRNWSRTNSPDGSLSQLDLDGDSVADCFYVGNQTDGLDEVIKYVTVPNPRITHNDDPVIDSISPNELNLIRGQTGRVTITYSDAEDDTVSFKAGTGEINERRLMDRSLTERLKTAGNDPYGTFNFKIDSSDFELGETTMHIYACQETERTDQGAGLDCKDENRDYRLEKLVVNVSERPKVKVVSENERVEVYEGVPSTITFEAEDGIDLDGFIIEAYNGNEELFKVDKRTSDLGVPVDVLPDYFKLEQSSIRKINVELTAPYDTVERDGNPVSIKLRAQAYSLSSDGEVELYQNSSVDFGWEVSDLPLAPTCEAVSAKIGGEDIDLKQSYVENTDDTRQLLTQIGTEDGPVDYKEISKENPLVVSLNCIHPDGVEYTVSATEKSDNVTLGVQDTVISSTPDEKQTVEVKVTALTPQDKQDYAEGSFEVLVEDTDNVRDSNLFFEIYGTKKGKVENNGSGTFAERFSVGVNASFSGERTIFEGESSLNLYDYDSESSNRYGYGSSTLSAQLNFELVKGKLGSLNLETGVGIRTGFNERNGYDACLDVDFQTGPKIVNVGENGKDAKPCYEKDENFRSEASEDGIYLTGTQTTVRESTVSLDNSVGRVANFPISLIYCTPGKEDGSFNVDLCSGLTANIHQGREETGTRTATTAVSFNGQAYNADGSLFAEDSNISVSSKIDEPTQNLSTVVGGTYFSIPVGLRVNMGDKWELNPRVNFLVGDTNGYRLTNMSLGIYRGF